MITLRRRRKRRLRSLIMLRAKRDLRSGILIACGYCYEFFGNTDHRPCYAVYCGCPCSYPKVLAVV